MLIKRRATELFLLSLFAALVISLGADLLGRLYLNLGNIYLIRKMVTEAKTSGGQRKLSESPDRGSMMLARAVNLNIVEAGRNLGLIGWATGKTDQALSIWRRVLQKEPWDNLTHFWVGQALLPLDREEALSHLKAARSSWYFINKAKLYAEDGKKRAEWVKLAVAINDEASADFYLEAVTLLLNEDPEYAVNLVEEARKLEGDYRYESYLMLGTAHHNLGNWDAAIRALRSGLQSYPEAPDLHYRLGLTLWKKDGKHSLVEEAAEHFKAAIQLYPGWQDKQPLSALGDMYYSIGDYDRAVYWYEQLVQIAPGGPGYRVDLAKAYKRSGDLVMAEETLRRAIERGPNYERFRFIIADVYLSLGKENEACQEFKAGLSLLPNGLDSYKYPSEVNSSLIELCSP